ncbi:MAG: hypothetical protein HOO88_03480 [Kiritimatiellaceae bacterium]|nr:hypothetical protein [Kiritimatiellaceae bacterium]
MSFFKFTKKRLLVLLLTLEAYALCRGFGDAIQFFRAEHPNLTFGLPASVSFKLSDISELVFLWKGVACFAVSALFVKLCFSAVQSDIYTTLGLDEVRRKKIELDKQTRLLLDLLGSKSGITQIFPAHNDRPVEQQPYAKAIRDQLKNTRTIRMLSMAGYECFGKGPNALIYEELADRPGLAATFLILNPIEDNPIIDKRLVQLRHCDPAYTKVNFIRDINKTITAFSSIVTSDSRVNTNSGALKLGLLTCDPVFRLLIFDNCLFMSTYEEDAHGHHTPMYRIDAPEQEGHTSLYGSFVRHFDLLCSQAEFKAGVR